MSFAPRVQLGLLPGFDGPLSISPEVNRGADEAVAKQAPRAVSAEREMRAAQVGMAGLAIDPPEIEGWREELDRRPAPRFDAAGRCEVVESHRRRADGTIGPCPVVTCPRHLLLDYGAPIQISGRRHAEVLISTAGLPPAMGRRPALAAVPTDGEADAFALDALRRLDEIPDTCGVDVQRRLASAAGAEVDGAEATDADREALLVIEIARVNGWSVEEVRLLTLSGAAKLGIEMVNGHPQPGDGARVEAILAQLDGTRAEMTAAERREREQRVADYLGIGGHVDPIAAIDRALLTDTSPPPAVIRRIEREAPAPRELTVDEIFGEGW